jgi:DNA-binding transcriptional LysR family regulator
MLFKKDNLIDTKLFNAFIAAAETENFTEAAKAAFMTQSGISQHIAKLEEQIGQSLFSRVGKQVFLNENGQELLAYIKEQVEFQNLLLNKINKQQSELTGNVSYAMPGSCMFSNHFSLLLEKKKKYPDLHLNVNLSDNKNIFELILNDKIDFGFVTHQITNPYLTFQHFCNESYILVTGDEALKENFDLARILDYKFISYPGSEMYYNLWLENYIGEKFNYYSLYKSGHINDIHGAIKMVMGNLGIGIFPSHCVQPKIDAKELFEIPIIGDLTESSIYIVSLKNKKQASRVSHVINWFLEMVSASHFVPTQH